MVSLYSMSVTMQLRKKLNCAIQASNSKLPPCSCLRCCNHHPTPMPAPAVLASTVIVEVTPTPLPARIVSPPPWLWGGRGQMLVDLLLARAATKAIDILLARAAPKVLNFLRATVSCSLQCDSHVKSRIQFTDNKVENNKSDKEPDVLAEEPQVSKRLKQNVADKDVTSIIQDEQQDIHGI